MTVIYFLLLLSVIITIHEAGHLLAAKKFHVYCYEFSFGMGPLLWHKKTNETQYSIRAIPIGGYVSMAGETDGDQMYPDVKVPRGDADRICVMHKNVPNLLTQISGVVSAAGINIHSMTNKSKKEYAYTILDIEGHADDSIVQSILAVHDVIRVRVL